MRVGVLEGAGGPDVAGLRRGVRALARALLLLLVHAYRVAVSPHLTGGCRYIPSCSAYALEAIDAHGPWRGTVLAARRVLRCHPFRPGGFDPVPEPGLPCREGGEAGEGREGGMRAATGAANGS